MKKLFLLPLLALLNPIYAYDSVKCYNDCLNQVLQEFGVIHYEDKEICSGLCQENDYSICIEAELQGLEAPEICPKE